MSGAVYTPELVTVPPLIGLTDQTRENPDGGFGEAVNVVVDPGATVAEGGVTVIFRGRGGGFEAAFWTCEPFPLPQLVSNVIANASPSRIAKSSFPLFPFGAMSAKSNNIGVSHLNEPGENQRNDLFRLAPGVPKFAVCVFISAHLYKIFFLLSGCVRRRSFAVTRPLCCPARQPVLLPKGGDENFCSSVAILVLWIAIAGLRKEIRLDSNLGWCLPVYATVRLTPGCPAIALARQYSEIKGPQTHFAPH